MEQVEKDQVIHGIAENVLANPPTTEGQEQVVRGLAEAELTGRIQTSSETYNLAQDLDEIVLKELGNLVYDGFSSDDQTRTEWLEKHTYWLSLYMQDDYSYNSDPERSWGATESVPILTEACDQFQSRTYKIFFPSDTFVSAVAMNKRKEDRQLLEERAERIGNHMSYQLGFLDRNFKKDKDALFLAVAVHGSFFTKTYFHQGLRRFKVDNVRPTDLVINYSVGPIRIEDVRRKTHVIYTSVGETEDLVNQKYFIEAARPANTSVDKNTYNIKVDEITGLTDQGYTKIKRDAPAVLLEQHSYYDIDGSGKYLPYIVTICAASRKVLRTSIGWEADERGNPTDEYKQIQYFTHYKYKENPDGFYGLGLGHSIGDLNSAVNISLRQALDAATLANDGNMSGFISERLGLEGDEIRMVLGKLIKIPDTVGELDNSIMLMKFPGPNAALIEIMAKLDERAQRMGAVTEATTGATDAVKQPTTYLAEIEQSLEQFSSVQMRLASALTDELQKIYKINQKFLPFVDYYIVNGAPEMITKADYQDDMLIQPIFDPKYTTQAQKVARAQAELQATLQNPVNQGRPQVIDEAFRRYFEALEVDNVDALVPPQPSPENFDDQYMENMFFLMPKEARPLFDVFPEQNHQEHLVKLQEFIAQYGQMLQPDQQEDVLKHQQKHMGYLYGQEHGIIPSGQVATAISGARPNNEMDTYPTTSAISPAQAELLSQIVGGAAPQGGGAESAGNTA